MNAKERAALKQMRKQIDGMPMSPEKREAATEYAKRIYDLVFPRKRRKN